MKLLITLLLFNTAVADDLVALPKTKRYHSKESTKKIHKKRTNNSERVLLEKIQRQNEKIEKILSSHLPEMAIYDDTLTLDIPPGSVEKGLLLNSIVSTNLLSPVLISVPKSKLIPPKSKLLCQAITAHRRVVVACNKLLTANGMEVNINANILNTDGSAGLRGDYYDGNEEYIASSMALAFSKGLIETSKDRTLTNLGDLPTQGSLKNKILEGLSQTTSESLNMVKENSSNKEPKVYINAGKEVLVFFNEKVSL